MKVTSDRVEQFSVRQRRVYCAHSQNCQSGLPLYIGQLSIAVTFGHPQLV